MSKQENKLKKKLELSEVRFRTVAETATDAIIIADRQSRIIFYNSKVVAIFGHSDDELLGQPLSVLMPSKYREAHKKGMGRFLETGIPHLIGHTVEIEGQRKDGVIFPIELSLSYWEEDGNPFFVGIIRNISDRKKAEEELKNLNKNLENKVKERTDALSQSTNQLKIITNTIPALIAYIDQYEVYRYANEYYYSILFINESLVGRTLKEVLGEQNYSRIKPKIERALKGETILFENKVPLKEGIVKDFEVQFLPDKDTEGNVRGIVAMAIDQTERLSYEKNLNTKNEELTRINNDLDNFIYTASHDLKAPVANIEGLINAINESTSYDKIPNDIKEFFEMIDRSVERFKRTIVDLTEISKAQKSNSEEGKTIDVEEVINEILVLIKDLIDSSKAKVSVEIEVQKIKFSGRNFRSIVYNLLSNAIKYRSPLRVPEIEVKVEKVEDTILLMVKDNGLGIPEENKDKVFEMFQRTHIHVEGTGIGLFIVKRIVDNAGGKIELDSELGVGSTFKIFLKE